MAVASCAGAGVLNIDFEKDLTGGDTTHSGSDGALSTGGSGWNSVEVATDESGLSNENGNATGVAVVPTSSGTGSDVASSTNDLQDSGTITAFDITGLVSGETDAIAVYGGAFMGHGITTSTGSTGDFCTELVTYSLPGTLDTDDCLWSNVMPADLGGGDFGFGFSGIDGVITGVQVSGDLGGGAAGADTFGRRDGRARDPLDRRRLDASGRPGSPRLSLRL